jgi:hypothetical protein
MSDVAVTFGAKDEGLASAFKKVGDQTNSLSSNFKKLLIPLAALGGAFLAIRKMATDFQAAIDMGGRLRELSLQTDESAGNLMILQRAFQNAGAGAENVGTTLARMNRFIAEANNGGTKQVEVMGKLGLTMADLAGKTPTEQLKLLAERVSGLQNPSDRAAVSMDLFGRSGAELIPLFRAMGVELENAQRQLGSAPAVADKAAAMFNTLGNNLKAVSEKSKEFAFGLLSELLPNLVAVTDRLATIDAAGLGAKFSEYAKRTLDWASNTFKLGDALEKVELAFKAITSGEIGDGLSLVFMTARDTALNAINQVWAAASATIDTIRQSLSNLLAFDGPVFKVASNAITLLGKNIELALSKAFLAAIPNIKLFGTAIEGLEANIAALPYEITAFEMKLGTSTKAAVEAVGDELKAAPERFRESYERNIENPLFEMEKRMEQTANHAAKIHQNLEEAAGAVGEINKFGLLQGPPMAPQTEARSDVLVGPPTPSGRPTVERERQMTARERGLIAGQQGRAQRLEQRGFFSAADRAREQSDRILQRARETEATRDLQREFGLRGGALMSAEEIARREGKVSSFDQDALAQRTKEIQDEIKRRAGQGDGTDGPEVKSRFKKEEDKRSLLEVTVEKIEKILEKIEPKLPTSALTA